LLKLPARAKIATLGMERYKKRLTEEEKLGCMHHDLVRFFPNKIQIISHGLKELVLPTRDESHDFGIIMAHGRELGNIVGMYPMEQDIMSMWFVRRISVLQSEHRKHLFGPPFKDPRIETDEQMIIKLLGGMGEITGHQIEGERNMEVRSWLLCIKKIADDLAKMITAEDFSVDKTLTFMANGFDLLSDKRPPVEHLLDYHLGNRIAFVFSSC
jgi:hypothetical protein